MPGSLLDKKNVIDRYLRMNPQHLSGFSFVNLFAWQGHWNYYMEEIDGCLCVFARNQLGVFMPWPPLGAKIRPETVEACFERMDKENRGCVYSRIDNVSACHLDVFPAEHYERYRKGYEYCYYRPDIVNLSGNGYKSKRPDLNYFIRCQHARFLPLTPDRLDDCSGLYDRWAKSRRQQHHDEIYCHMLDENRSVHRLVLENVGALGLAARVVEIDGCIRAYTCGYPLNHRIFCVLLEIADLQVRGLPVYVFQRFCSDEQVAAYPFINVMDDSGMNNMVRAKMSFRPRILFASYVITKK